MRRCLIIAGGDYAPIGPVGAGDFVLACDRGYAYCQREGIVPDLILGDLDSYRDALPGEIPVLRYPAEKDDTDRMLAVRWAHEQGFDAVIFFDEMMKLYCFDDRSFRILLRGRDGGEATDRLFRVLAESGLAVRLFREEKEDLAD